eukprot:TRINITY_DN4676_c0_g1_i7.p1 TRINITY_DN4676_c0_g1~~TRINITY_DN4676_c0_g1_i7.p1  ORF type:complete len:438 (+),score=89.39 TRINITY_DN4676_c0_g1_i7:234-1547(+)
MKSYFESVSGELVPLVQDHFMKVDKMNAKQDSARPIESGGGEEEANFGDAKERIFYYVLDRVRFPNGTAYWNAKLPQRVGVVPHIVHNNCIIGHDSKVERFKQYNMWWIGGNCDTSWLTKPTTISDLVDCLPSFHPLQVLKGHIEIVVCLALHGSVLYSSGYDKIVRKWSIGESGGCTLMGANFVNKVGGIWSFAFTPDGRTVFTGGHDRKIFQWDCEDWKKLNVMKGHVGIINSLCLVSRTNPSSGVQENLLFSASDDGDVFSWDVEKGERRRIYRGHRSWVSCLTVSGPVLYTAGHDGYAIAWEIESGRILQQYVGHEGWVRSLLVQVITAAGDSGMKKHLWTGGSDALLRCWDVKSGECLLVLQGHRGGINAIALDGNILYSASDDRTILAWNTVTGSPIRRYIGHEGMVSCLVVGNRHLYSGSYDRTVQRWFK